ncbi:hypothetical protein L226DRAFT_583613, partial [Lentinus tigrinus ALCF2SS1-7]|uniref:uncharacterized protein n=1 Tax=Lentinus tigrinus ALCF2SS1-7 TaxID=1328758 RepID=UPI0011660016
RRWLPVLTVVLQVFTAKSAEFREALASILGAKLAFYPNGQVRATSRYDLNAAFVFQPNGQGENMKMQLVHGTRRRRTGGPPAADAVLGRARTVHTGFLGECHAGVLREEQ